MKRLLLFVLLISGFCFGQKYEGMEFYDNGKPKVIKTYKVSKDKIELVKEVGWYDNGQKKIEENFLNGKPNGLATWWYENGQVRLEITYNDGKVDGKWILFYENGQVNVEGTYKNLEGTYKDGEIEYEMGWDGLPVNGKDGLFITRYENGQKKSELTYKDGEEDGLYTEWYENGQKMSELTYKDGKLDGLSTIWYENGQKEIEGTYKDRERDGLWTQWYENGQKEEELTYKDGQFISEECWDENGNNQNCYEMPMGGEPFIKNINLPYTKYLFENGVVFVDARTEELFIEGHIKNALNSDSFEELIFKIESLQTKDVAVVVYCSGDECGSSEDLAYELQAEGFTNLYVFKGGWKSWTEAGYPTENQ